MNKRLLKRIKRHDRIARWLISAGGVGVIFCVLLMLLLIVSVTLPLFRSAHAELAGSFTVAPEPDRQILAVGLDEYLETAFTLNDLGLVTFYVATSGTRLNTFQVPAPAGAHHLLNVEPHGNLCYSLLWDNGAAALVQVAYAPEYAQGERSLARKVKLLASRPADGEKTSASLMRSSDDGHVQVSRTQAGFRVRRETTTTDLLGNEKTDSADLQIPVESNLTISTFTADRQGRALYAGTADGQLLHWDISGADNAVLVDRVNAFRDGRGITSLALVFGDISLAVGDTTGEVTIWRPVKLYPDSETRRLARVFALTRYDSRVQRLAPSVADKSVLSLDYAGILHLSNMTSRRDLITFNSLHPIRHFQICARGTGLVALDAANQLWVWRVANPHPEFSWDMLFSRVWYENYDQPACVWQSSAANDDFETKTSFIPLIFGSLKATLYAMLFAVPLALFGAVYVSQFTTYEVRGIVKPTVEVMAAVPSVVIGFLIALWLAPRVETGIVAIFLFAVTIPAAFLIFLGVWQWVRQHEWAKRLERGREFVLLAPVVLTAVAVAYLAAPTVERLLFNGDFRLWLFKDLGTRYDQRNSIIIAFGLGFAVIPIVFTIAEDALSNVPKSLKAASLALGASRWQTVWRVVLPSASPGVFAAMIIGFGRAVGETMIVLMATGNTPIMSPSLFNGMRTLSANIAVEIPEAPVGGTLYRVLFLSAVLLFLLTSLLNTAAELIRHHLRQKYGRFQ